MQQNKTLVVDTSTVEQTERLAETLGSRLKGGECIELISDLGGGKTTFTRGIVAGAKSDDAVSSPTFTITKVYKAEKFHIHHFDFYRLPDAGLAAHELNDVINDKNIVLIVEWGAVVQDVLPSDRLTIVFDKTGESARKITFHAPARMQYLVESI